MSSAAPHLVVSEGGVASDARFAVAALLAGLVAAVVIPGVPVGVNVILVVVAVGAAVAVARPRPFDWGTVAYIALGLALSAMAAVRSAEWIVSLDLLFAAGLAALAAAGGAGWMEIVRAPLRVLGRVPRSLPFVARSLDASGGWVTALRGASVGAVLLLTFGACSGAPTARSPS